MRRLGLWSVMDSEPDSGHPTPRDDEDNTEESNGNLELSDCSPLTSTPVRSRREASFRQFLEKSEQCHLLGNNSDTAIIVESVKQLIHTTEKNRRLTKENGKILNRSMLWDQEKSNMEKQLRDADMLAESLRKQVKEKSDKIDLLERRLSHLLKTMEEHPAEEVPEAVEELLTEKKEVDHLREKCASLELEIDEMRKEEKALLNEMETKSVQHAEVKRECERLREEIASFHIRNRDFTEVQAEIIELKRLLSNANVIVESQKAVESDLKSRIVSYEQQIDSLKSIDRSTKQLLDDKVEEVNKLKEECTKLGKLSSGLAEENISMTVLTEELKLRLSRAHDEIEGLRSSVANERQARHAVEEASRQCIDLSIKLREQSIQVSDLTTANEKMSAELDFLQQQEIATSATKEMERCSGALAECERNLERAITEKKVLLDKEEFYKEEIAKVNSLRMELKSRDDIIAELKLAKQKLQEDLRSNSAEFTELRDQLRDANYECCKIRKEFRDFQESAEHQYCATVKEKCEIIEAMSARLAQLESYPGQLLSMDGDVHRNYGEEKMKHTENGTSCCPTLYDCVSPAIRDAIERAVHISKDVANIVKLMQNTYIPKELGGVECATEQRPLTTTLRVAQTQTPSFSLREKKEVIFNQLINSIGNLVGCNAHVGSPDVGRELKFLLISIMNDSKSVSMESAVHRFLEDCHKHFSESAMELVSKERKTLLDEKQSLEKIFSSEKLKWDVERGNMELQLNRFRRQAEKAEILRKEKANIASELNAAKVQIDQYGLKLQQKTEELEAVVTERDVVAQLATEFKKLDQESQGQIIEANSTIDQLEGNLRSVRADLENARRELIHLKDENDANSLHTQGLKTQIADFERKTAELERRCAKLSKTEKYNQKTIQIVCESFWEREEFLQRLKQRSYERKKLIEHFVEKVGDIIATFDGDSHPVEKMHATIKSWTAADVEDEIDNESKEKALHAQVVELGSGEQFDQARKRVANRSIKRP
uniref:Girdin n=1 Tax=Angiostrongylus cantonensis TaxID=6313 RepID=A0A158P6W1_ANGCA